MKKGYLIWKAIVFSTVLAAFSPAFAQTFQYNSGDLLVCFRNTVNSVNDLVVDAGPVSGFTNLANGTKIVISQFTGSQLAAVGTNNLAWSAFATDNNSPIDVDLWVSKPRADFDTQTSPWNTGDLFAQAPPAGKIDSIGNDAITIGLSLPAGMSNTPTALVETESGHKQTDNGCYAFYMGMTGNFGNTFQGDAEQTTAANFTSSGQPVRADFYQLLSTTNTPAPPATFLGYFEFSTNGSLTFTAGPSPVVIATPVITSVSRSGNTTTITFTTGNSGTYSLCETNSAGLVAPRATWPVVGSVPGNGSTQSLSDTTADANRFYIISAQ